jgi:hypothetical protein
MRKRRLTIQEQFDFGLPFDLQGIDVERYLRGFRSVRYVQGKVVRGGHLVATMPRTIPAGRVLVHNQVRHQVDTPCGWQGFRAWTQKPSNKLESCRCGWAGLRHCRVKHVAPSRLRKSKPR